MVNTNKTGQASPTISVIIYTYNNEAFVSDCVESILTQTLSPFEVIICDDHSLDGTWAIVETYQKKYPHLIRAYRHDKNMGMHFNANFGLQQAKGDLINSLGGDDRWLPRKLELEWKALQDHPEAKIAYSNVITIDSRGDRTGIWYDGSGPELPSGDVFVQVFSKKFFPNNRSIFRNQLIYRSVYEEVGGYDFNIPIHIDWDLKVRQTCRYKVAYSGEALVEYRIHGKGVHNQSQENLFVSEKAVVDKNLKLLESRSASEAEEIKKGIKDLLESYSRPKTASGKSYRGENLIFLLSLPRSGSTMLQRILGSHTAIHTVSEPWIMLHPLYALKDKGMQSEYEWPLGKNALDDFLAPIPEGPELYVQSLRAMAEILYGRALEMSGKTFFLDKTPRYYFVLDELTRVFPAAKFVFLFRNPLAVLASMLETWFQFDMNKLKSSYNYKDLIEGPEYLVKGIDKLGEKAAIVRYEDLVFEPGETVARLFRKLGIQFEPRIIQYGRHSRLTGRYGDQKRINQHEKPVADYAAKWIENLKKSPEIEQFTYEYMEKLGEKIFSQFGYGVSEIKKQFRTGHYIAPSAAIPSESEYVTEITQLREKQDLNHALATVTNALQNYPGSILLSNIKVEILVETGNVEAAESLLNQILQRDPENIDALNNLAVVYIIRNEFQKAVQILKNILGLQPDNEVAFQNLEYAVEQLRPAAETGSEAFPMISVVTPSFNQAEFIEDTIQSVLSQNYPNFEHIIIDGGSTDGTVDILKKYPHLTWISEKDKGQTDALNKGLLRAGGDVIAILNSDDTYTAGAFHKVAEAFAAAADTKAIIGDCFFSYTGPRKPFTVRNKDLDFEDLLKYWNIWIPPTQPAIFFKSELIEEFGPFDQNLNYAMDYEYWLRISRQYKIKHIPEILAVYRFHDVSKSGNGDDWSDFFPEWHSVYLKYKQYSQRLPQQPLLTVGFPFEQNMAGDSEYAKRFAEAVKWYATQRLRDAEILIITDGKKSLIPQLEIDSGTDIRIVKTEKLDEDSFRTTLNREAAGFAIHCPSFELRLPDTWYYEAFEALFNNDNVRVVNDPRLNSAHEVLQNTSEMGPDRLVRNRKSMAEKYTFSVIIPTYNRSGILKKCLDALTAQTFPAKDFEVFVCDDGSTDDTEQVVREYAAPYSLHYLKQKNSGPAAARNKGIRAAQGQFLLILNDDAILEPSALRLHLETHRNHGNSKIAVLGKFAELPEFAYTPFGYLLENSDVLFWYSRMKAGQLYDYNYFYTCNISILRRAVIEAGLFDEDFTGPAAEDLELGYRLGKQGYRVLYNPEIVSWHDHQITPEGFCRVQQTRGMGAVTLALKHPEIPFHRNINRQTIETWRRGNQLNSARVQEALKPLMEVEESVSTRLPEKELREYIKMAMPLVRFLHHYFEREGIMASPDLESLLEMREKMSKPGDQNIQEIVTPLISVVIPCYNYGHYLTEAVESVVAQSYSNFEIVIVNDGSTDNSREVAEELIGRFPDHQIKLINQKNSGQPAITRNRGIEAAAGSYILPLDADDKLAPQALESYVNALRKTGTVNVVVFGWMQTFGSHQQVWKTRSFAPDALLRRNQLPSSALFHRRVWEEQNGYSTNCKGYEDWDFWIGAAENGAAFVNVAAVTFLYRETESASLHDFGQNRHEWNFANIVLNHHSVYEDDEVEWASAYLKEHAEAPEKRDMHPGDEKFPRAVAAMIISYPEIYTAAEAEWAEQIFSGNPFSIFKGIKSAPSPKVVRPEQTVPDSGTANSNRPSPREVATPAELPVTAIIAAYNEGDVIYHVIRDLVEQNIRVVLIDHHSDDNTVSEAEKWLGKGLAWIEKFPEAAGVDLPDDVYAWRYILRRKEQIAAELGPGWYIHADADEFRESPWPELSLRQGIEKVDREGYNSINFRLLDFKPTDNTFQPGDDVRLYLQYYSKPHVNYDNLQLKCWKYSGQEFNLWKSGGHQVEFEGRRIFPLPFVCRHYPVRSQEHGLKKVFRERRNRFDKQERSAKWHIQYDHVADETHNFIHEKSALQHFERAEICRNIQAAAVNPQPGSARKVSIIMLTLNALDYTRQCVDSIRRCTGYPHEIIFVDNGSADGTRKYLRNLVKENSNYHLISNKKNRGFAGGNNQGAKKATGDYVLFLNNDVLVSDGWLESLVESLELEERIGVVGPITNRINGRQRLAEVPYSDVSQFPAFAQRVRAVNKGKVTPRRRLGGFAMLMKKALFDAVGGFDEDFGLGNYEDDDLCLRIRDRGYAVMVDEGTYIHHFGGRTFVSNKLDYEKLMTENGKKFREKWPAVDFEELLEIKNPLDQLHPQLMKKAEALMNDGNFAEAGELLDRILEQNPIDTGALYAKSLCSRHEGQTEDVSNCLNRIVRLKPGDAAALNQLGITFFESGKPEEAKRFFIAAVENNPSFVEAQRNYAELLLETGEYDSGVAAYVKILQNHPADVPALVRMAQLFTEVGRLDEARQYANKAIEFNPENAAVLELLKIIDGIENKACDHEAAAHAAMMEAHPDPMLTEGQTALEEKEAERAIGLFNDILNRNDQDAAARYGLGLAYQVLEDWEQAAECFSRVTELIPEFSAAHNNLGMARMNLENPEGAREAFVKALELDPEDGSARLNLSEVLLQIGNYQEGVDLLFENLKQNPEDILILQRIGTLYVEAGRENEAMPYYEKILRLDPEHMEARKFMTIFQG